MLKVLINKRGKGEELKWEGMSSEELATLASTPDMFSAMRTFVLRDAINSERQDEFLDLAEVFAESPHTFIFEEEKLLKAPTTALEKAGAKIEKSAQGGSASGRKEWQFDQFGVASALGNK